MAPSPWDMIHFVARAPTEEPHGVVLGNETITADEERELVERLERRRSESSLGSRLRAPLGCGSSAVGASGAAPGRFGSTPRSGYVLAGEARWSWEHSIPPTKELRYSITFHTLT